MKIFVRYPLLLLLFHALTGCQHNLAVPVSEMRVAPVHEFKARPVQIPAEYGNIIYHDLRNKDDVWNFYQGHSYQPFWLEKNRRGPRADSMIVVIRSSRRYGLLPQRYHLAEIPELLLEPSDSLNLARLDIILTDAFLSLAYDLRNGRMIKQKPASPDHHVQPMQLMDSLKFFSIKKVLETQEPQYPEYLSLKKALGILLDTINPNDRNLLIQGMTIDSVRSHRTVQQIEINMERWRNENSVLDNAYVWINIPAFKFYAIENQQVVLESPVIVGASQTPTPVFSSSIECFTIFPYWNVPRKITVQEYLPVIKRDTTFLIRNNFDVLDRNGNIQKPSSIEWGIYNADNFPFTLRQREGTENSLGIIKFIFDNPYAVYLHDTNSKKLFRNAVRAYSHGCIRLERAFEFARYLVRSGRTTTNPGALEKFLTDQKRRTVSMTRMMPIHVRYFTCEVRDHLLVQYRDIYKKDAAMIRVLYADTISEL